jgi:hypothetical protein
MQDDDQRLLRELMDAGELREEEYHPCMRAVHERNNARIKVIVDEYSRPDVSLVAPKGVKAAWLIVQRTVLDTEFMERAFPVLKEAVKDCKAEGRNTGRTLKAERQVCHKRYPNYHHRRSPTPCAAHRRKVTLVSAHTYHQPQSPLAEPVPQTEIYGRLVSLATAAACGDRDIFHGIFYAISDIYPRCL